MVKLNSFSKRCLSSIAMLFISLGAFYLGGIYFQAFLLVLGGFIAFEWANAVPKENKYKIYFPIYLLSMLSLCLAPIFIGLGVVALLSVVTWFVARKEEFRKITTLGVIYISLGMAALFRIYVELPVDAFPWLVLVVWGMDIGGYLVGCTVGGPKLMPKISPNKTWSGLIGGICLAVVFSCAFSYLMFEYFDLKEMFIALMGEEEFESYVRLEYILTSVFAALFAVISQIGDLIQSAIKRHIGVKDFSNLIPGHGGFFDRFDALLFAGVIYYIGSGLLDIFL